LKIFLTISFIFINFLAYSQDLIVLKSGEELKTKIISTKEDYIIYRLFDDLSGELQTIEIYEILLIRYKDGTNVIYDETEKKDTTFLTTTRYEVKERAIADAKANYKATEPILIAVCTSLSCPYIGILPSLVIANEPPKQENLNIPEEYKSNMYYVGCYKDEAFRIKKNRVTWATIYASTPYILMLIYLMS